MARERNHGLLIAGGGIAGSLAALAMARLRPEVPMLLAAEGSELAGGRTALLLEEGLADEERALPEPLASGSWDGCYVAFPGRSRKLKLRCHAVSPRRIEAAVREALRPEQIRLDAKLVAVRDTSLLLQGGETLSGDGALDARPWAQQTILEVAWRRSFGRHYSFSAPHRVDLPVLVDTTLSEGKGCGLFSCIPFGETRLLVEYAEYGAGPEMDAAAAGARLDDYVAKRGWRGGKIEGEESQSQPLPLGGDFGAYWRTGGARVAKIGARGGFLEPVTGSVLTDALRTALLLTRQRDFSGEALHDLFEEEAAELWRKRELQRGINRLLVQGGKGCAALEGLYGLEPALIGRFHSDGLGLFDRRKLIAATEG
jgi:lycopene beta-cyclase